MEQLAGLCTEGFWGLGVDSLRHLQALVIESQVSQAQSTEKAPQLADEEARENDPKATSISGVPCRPSLLMSSLLSDYH